MPCDSRGGDQWQMSHVPAEVTYREPLSVAVSAYFRCLKNEPCEARGSWGCNTGFPQGIWWCLSPTHWWGESLPTLCHRAPLVWPNLLPAQNNMSEVQFCRERVPCAPCPLVCCQVILTRAGRGRTALQQKYVEEEKNKTNTGSMEKLNSIATFSVCQKQKTFRRSDGRF